MLSLQAPQRIPGSMNLAAKTPLSPLGYRQSGCHPAVDA